MTHPVIRQLQPEDRATVRALIPRYMQEIAPGLLPPSDQQIAAWWTDPTRHAFTIHAPDLAGFAFIRTLPNGTHEMSEFYILPRHRRGGIGRSAVAALIPRFPGRWQLGIAKADPAARQFWTNVLAAHRVRRGPPLTPQQSGSFHFTVEEPNT